MSISTNIRALFFLVLGAGVVACDGANGVLGNANIAKIANLKGPKVGKQVGDPCKAKDASGLFGAIQGYYLAKAVDPIVEGNGNTASDDDTFTHGKMYAVKVFKDGMTYETNHGEVMFDYGDAAAENSFQIVQTSMEGATDRDLKVTMDFTALPERAETIIDQICNAGENIRLVFYFYPDYLTPGVHPLDYTWRLEPELQDENGGETPQPANGEF